MTLKDESGQSSATGGTARVRKALVCAQVTISAMLLIPTGLFLKSLVNLLHVDLGMKTENVIGFAVSPSLNGYKPEQSRALFERAEAELAAIPGVRGVADALVPLIAGSNWGNSVKIEGAPAAINNDANARFNEVGPGYFGKMGIPLIAGREFTEADNLARPKVAIVSQQFVKAFLEGRNPIGVQDRRGQPGIRHRDRRRGQGQPLRRRQAGPAQALLHAVAAGQAAQRAHVLRALGAAGRTRCSSRCGA